MTAPAEILDVIDLFDRPHALYRMYGPKGELLYVGITFGVVQRLRGHRGSQPWWPEVATIKLEHFANRQDALVAEAAAIKAERPLYNILLQPGPVPDLLPRVESNEMRRLRLAVAARRRAETAETAAVIAALEAGETQVAVAQALGRSREHVRLLLRKLAEDS